jgi:hypothetical protein
MRQSLHRWLAVWIRRLRCGSRSVRVVKGKGLRKEPVRAGSFVLSQQPLAKQAFNSLCHSPTGQAPGPGPGPWLHHDKINKTPKKFDHLP